MLWLPPVESVSIPLPSGRAERTAPPGAHTVRVGDSSQKANLVPSGDQSGAAAFPAQVFGRKTGAGDPSMLLIGMLVKHPSELQYVKVDAKYLASGDHPGRLRFCVISDTCMTSSGSEPSASIT